MTFLSSSIVVVIMFLLPMRKVFEYLNIDNFDKNIDNFSPEV